MEKLRKIVTLLDGVLKGALTADKALGEWPNIDIKKIKMAIESANHDLNHFQDDNDIHRKDEAYKRRQLDGLKKHLKEIQVLLDEA